MTDELAGMDVWRMRRALVCLAGRAPIVIQALLTRALPPAAAQLLTHRFEQADSVLLSTGMLRLAQRVLCGLITITIIAAQASIGQRFLSCS